MRRAAALLAAAGALAAGGCGGDEPRLTVSAASSLKEAFTDYGGDFDEAQVRLSFAGSDQLAAQIRAGARPDVFAAANQDLPGALHREGLVERPVPFAKNRLVVAVPAGGDRVGGLDDLAKPEIRIAAGAPGVPVGAYTRLALAGLPTLQSKAIEANIVTEEPDAAAVIGRVRSRAVDAGFAYVTDTLAAHLAAIELPHPVEAVYAAAVVRGGDHVEEARSFVRGLGERDGREALREAGFE